MRYQTFELGELDIHVRSLRDRQQFADDDGDAARHGICSASWPMFGVLWDSGHALARMMVDYDVGERRVLEVGCGLGLASLVLNRREADITATDHHPEAGFFLGLNAELNGGPPIPFVRAGWDDAETELPRFDLVIGSDLLYERGHAESLAGFIDRHAQPTAEVIMLDPGRKQGGRFGRELVGLGYDAWPCAASDYEDAETYPGQILRYRR